MNNISGIIDPIEKITQIEQVVVNNFATNGTIFGKQTLVKILLGNDNESITNQEIINEFETNIEDNITNNFKLSLIINNFFAEIFSFDLSTSSQLILKAKQIITKYSNNSNYRFIKQIFGLNAFSFFVNVNGIDFFNEKILDDDIHFLDNIHETLSELKNCGEFETLKNGIFTKTYIFIDKFSKNLKKSGKTIDLLSGNYFNTVFKEIFGENIENIINEKGDIDGGLVVFRYLNTLFSYFGYVLFIYLCLIFENSLELNKGIEIDIKFISNYLNVFDTYISFLQSNSNLITNSKSITIVLVNLNITKQFFQTLKELCKLDIIKNTSIQKIIEEQLLNISLMFELHKHKGAHKDMQINNKILENFLLKMGGIEIDENNFIQFGKLINENSDELHQLCSFTSIISLFRQKMVEKFDLKTSNKLDNNVGKKLSDLHTFSDSILIKLTALLGLKIVIKNESIVENKLEESQGKTKEEINKSLRMMNYGDKLQVNLGEALQILKKSISLLTGQTYDEKNVNFRFVNQSDSIQTRHKQAEYFEDNDILYHYLSKFFEIIVEPTKIFGIRIEPIFEKNDQKYFKGYIADFNELGHVLVIPYNYLNYEEKEKKGYLLIKLTYGKDIKNNFYLKDNGELLNIILAVQNKHEQHKKLFWLVGHVITNLDKHHKDTSEHCKRLPNISKIILECLKRKKIMPKGFEEITYVSNRLDIEIDDFMYLCGCLHDVGKKEIDLKALDTIKFSEYSLSSISSFLNEFLGLDIDTIGNKAEQGIRNLTGTIEDKAIFQELISDILKNPEIITSIHQGLDKLKTYDRNRKSDLNTKEGTVTANIFQLDLLNSYKIYKYLEDKYKDKLNGLIPKFAQLFKILEDDHFNLIVNQLKHMGISIKLNQNKIKLIIISLFFYYSIENRLLIDKVKDPHINAGLNYFRTHPELQPLTCCLLHHTDYPTIQAIIDTIGLRSLKIYSENKLEHIQKLPSNIPIPIDLKPFISVVLTIGDILDALMGSRSYHETKTTNEKFERAIGQLEKMKINDDSKTMKIIISLLIKDEEFKTKVLEYYYSKSDEIDPQRHILST